MKKSILMIAVLFAATIVYAQEIPVKSVPAKVQGAILTVFPEVAHSKIPVKWEKEGLNYKASLFSSTPKVSYIVIDSLATVLMVERKVSNESLPPKAKEYLTSQYHDSEMEISEVYMITAKGKTSYRTKVIVKPEYVFDSKGQIISPKNEPKSK